MAITQLEKPTFFDLFKANCADSDLGPISLNWFEELTAEALPYESKACKEHECRLDWLDENDIKTPKQKPSTYSQLASTPVIFKERSFSSPLFLSPTTELYKSRPVSDKKRSISARPSRSPCAQIQHIPNDDVFSPSSRCLNESPAVMKEMFKTPLRDKKTFHRTPQQDGKSEICGSLFRTPKLMRNQTPQCISESLGAEVDPEMSWSSSLATPPSPTVLVARGNDQVSRPKTIDNKTAMIVQSLFSKWDNGTEQLACAPPSITEAQNEKDDKPLELHTNSEDSFVEMNGGAHAPSDRVEVPWKQTVPNALRDGEVRQTVENVLEGMEDVLSIFFTSERTTGLRKVKNDNRVRRKDCIKAETGKPQKLNSLLENPEKENTSIALKKPPERDTYNQSNKLEPENENKNDITNKTLVRETFSTYEWSQLNLCDLNATQLEKTPLDSDNISHDYTTLRKSEDSIQICKSSQTQKSIDTESKNINHGLIATGSGSNLCCPEKYVSDVLIVGHVNPVSEKRVTVSENSHVNVRNQCSTFQQCEREKIFETDIPEDCSDNVAKFRASDNPTYAAQSTSGDGSGNGLRERNTFGSPQGANLNRKTLLSTLKKQPKFIYCINNVLSAQDGRNTKDTSWVSSNVHPCTSKGPAAEIKGDQKGTKELDSNTEESAQSQQKIETEANEVGGNLKNDSLNFQEMERNIISTNHVAEELHTAKSPCTTQTNLSDLGSDGKTVSSIKRKVLATACLLARKHPKAESLNMLHLKQCSEKDISQNSEILHEAALTSNQMEHGVLRSRMCNSTCEVDQIRVMERKPETLSCQSELAKKTAITSTPQTEQLPHDTYTILNESPPEMLEKRPICIENVRKKCENGEYGSENPYLRDFNMESGPEGVSRKAAKEQVECFEASLCVSEGSEQTRVVKFTDLLPSTHINLQQVYPNCEDLNVKLKSASTFNKMNVITLPVCNIDLLNEQCGGFKTASNKKIHVSEENIRKGQHLFKEIETPCLASDAEHKTEEKKDSLNVLTCLDDPTWKVNLKGFKTASNKQIRVSESKFATGRLLFKDIEDIIPNSESPRDTKECKMNEVDLFTKPTSNIKLDVFKLRSRKETDSETIGNMFFKETKVQQNADYSKEGNVNSLGLNKHFAEADVPTAENHGIDHIQLFQSQTIPIKQKGTLCNPRVAAVEVKENNILDLSTKILSHVNECLTESQKAEVHELSCILENAGSQCEFTQFRKGNTGLINNVGRQSSNECLNESENPNSSDLWIDVDFNDSFATGGEKTENDVTGLSSSEKACNVREMASIRKHGGTAINACELVESDSGPSIPNSFHKPNERTFGGFSLASGKTINIANEVLVKAAALFKDLENISELNDNSVKDNRKKCSDPCPTFNESNKVNCESTDTTDCDTEHLLCCNDASLLVTNAFVKDASLDYNVDESHKQPFHINCSKNVSEAEKDTSFPALNSIPPSSKTTETSIKSDEKLASHSEQLEPEKEALKPQNTALVPPIKGFQTTRGKPVMFSQSSLEKERNIFADDHLDNGAVQCAEFAVDTRKQVHVTQSVAATSSTHNANIQPKDFPISRWQQQNTSTCKSSNNKDPMPGFSTASGKKVTITAESLAKVRNLFDEENPSGMEKENTAFKQPNNQVHKQKEDFPILNQDSSVKEVENLSEDTPSGKNAVARVKCDDMSRSAIHEVCVQTGRNLSPRLTPEHLDMCDVLASNEKGSRIAALASSTMPIGFSTGKGKHIHVNEVSLLKASNIFNDLSSPTGVSKDDHNPHLLNGSNLYQCLPRGTCVKEKVTLSSEDCIKSSENHIIDLSAKGHMPIHITHSSYILSTENNNLKEMTMTEGINEKGINMAPITFSTASGKTVAVSPNSLRKAKLMFSETSDDDVLSDIGCKVQQKKTKVVTSSPKQEPDNELFTISNSLVQCTTFKPPPFSFATASRKAVGINKPTLKHARTMFPAINAEEMSQVQSILGIHSCIEVGKNEGLPQPDVFIPHKVSFSTASGKSVQLSNESLQKAKQMFSEIDNIHLPQQPTHEGTFDDKRKPTFKGEEAKDSMQEELEIKKPVQVSKNKSPLNTTMNPNSFGFSTAGGKKVSVSESALQKVKGMLQGFDDIGNFQENEPFIRKHVPDGKNSSTSTLNTPEEALALSNNLNYLQNDKEMCFKDDYANRKSLTKTHCSDVSMSLSPPPVCARDSTPGQTIKTSANFMSKDMPCIPNKSKPDLYFTTSHTPENYFEIEAAESAKAFMDDEDLMDLGLVTEDTVSYADCHKNVNARAGKRLRTEGGTSRGEPPIKRQLLPEFDRSTENQSKSSIKPLTSTPDGTIKDRRKFLYNITLKPSTCDPASFLKGRHDAQIPNLTAPNQFQFKSDIFQHCSSHKPAEVSAVPTSQLNSSATARDEKTETIPSSRRPGRTFVPPFKNKSSTLSSDQTSYAPKSNTRDDELINTVTEDRIKESEAESTACILEDRAEESDFLQTISNLRCGRDVQEMRIRKKQRQKIKPQLGSLYLLRTSSANRIPLLSAVQGKRPTVYSKEQLYRYGVVKNLLGVNSETAATFQFHCSDYFTKHSLLSGNGVQLADGGWLIPTDQGKAGKEEIYRALCDTPGVDPKLISPEWVYNHYRWIVWKLAAMEVTFPKEFASRCLTPERVLLQLKYRYNVEIDQSQRSAIKKIMEKDDSPAKTLVLCVSKIISLGTGLSNPCNNKSESGDSKQDSTVIEVTDGWYGIKTVLDPALAALLRRGRLYIGQKIIVHGAELIGSDDACTPLEAPESLMLKIAANSTRPACWYTKLGYFQDPRPFCLRLSSLFSEGGTVGCVDVVIQRIYPMQWMEKMANGLYVFRNDRVEEIEAEKHSIKQQKTLEVLFAKIQAEFENQEKVYVCSEKRKNQLIERRLNWRLV
ncbi:hypothetical protein FKM82_009628 [Ascaphus truei]